MSRGLNVSVPIDIYWFSGRGNSLLIAEEITADFAGRGHRVNLLPIEKSDPSVIGAKAVIGFVVPVAGQGTYPLVWEFLEGLPTVHGTPCFFVDTLGAYSGGILGPVRNILRKKGFAPLAAKEILMPNIVAKRKSVPEKDAAAVESGRKQAREFCEKLVNGKGSWFDIPVYSWIISRLYCSRKLVKSFIRMYPWSLNSEKCSRCGICISLCPEKCLSLDQATGLPSRSEQCTLCHRCFEFCQSEAINIGKRETTRYAAVSLGAMQSRLKARASSTCSS